MLALSFPNKPTDNKPVYRLKEPVLIASSKGQPYYMIAANTAPHLQEGFAKAHQLYMAGARTAVKNLDHNISKYNKGRGMSTTEQSAAKLTG